MMHTLVSGFAALAVILSPGAFAQQDYPSRPIRVIVPYPPGGTTDLLARMLSQKLTERLGQPLVIDNRPGAGGAIGTTLAAKAAPDGYTLDFGNLGPNAINPSLSTLQYDAEKDLAPISIVGSVPLIIITAQSARSVQDLIAQAKANPGKLTFGSVGIGSVSHVSGELFNSMAGTRMVHVPYKGGAPAVQAALTGEVTIMFATSLEAIRHIKSGKVRALGITSSKRSPVAPDIPTVSESGLSGFEVDAWFGLLAPAATPRAIVERLSREVAWVVDVPEIRAKFADLAVVPMATTPDQFAAIIRADIAKWAKVIKESGAKAE